MGIIIQLLVTALALIVTAYVVPGITVATFGAALVAAIVIAVINLVVKPIIMLVTLPVNVVTLGLFTFIINGLLLWLAAAVVPGFDVDGAIPAILGAIVLALVSMVLNKITGN